MISLKKIVTKSYDKHYPEKYVKFNEYKHKPSNWITSGILKYIEFRDKLYKRLKMCFSESDDYELLKHNLKIYNSYLNQCIRTAKRDFITMYLANIKMTYEKRGIH